MSMEQFRCLLWNTKKLPGVVSELLRTECKGDKMYDLVFLVESHENIETELMNNWTMIVQNLSDSNNILSVFENKEIRFRKRMFFLSHDVIDPIPNIFLDLQFRVLHFIYLKKYLFFLVHLPSLFDRDKETTFTYALELARYIRSVEDKISLDPKYNFKGRASIVLGDFNMNPFDLGMMHPCGFNALYARDTFINHHGHLVNELNLSILGKFNYPLFYNPIWSLLGKANEDIKATQYTIRPKGRQVDDSNQLRNNFFDQILIRPRLIHNFVMDDLEIITHVGRYQLAGRKALKTDHYPIQFTLKLELL